ncbi:MAG: hypothetical protein IT459_05615 [Planctomycetes bacterium]|nr:hypothetical protein [Planctomycetota bacterium]
MPCRDQHEPVGVVAGGLSAAFLADRANGSPFVEGIGGALGGWLGARLPDIVDPPLSPRHRSVGHGVVPTLAALRILAGQIPRWQASLRQKADELTAAQLANAGAGQLPWNRLLAFCCLLLSGAVVGLVVGYATHLYMDAMTASGLPFIA